jgi:hypothetical protein
MLHTPPCKILVCGWRVLYIDTRPCKIHTVYNVIRRLLQGGLYIYRLRGIGYPGLGKSSVNNPDAARASTKVQGGARFYSGCVHATAVHHTCIIERTVQSARYNMLMIKRLMIKNPGKIYSSKFSLDSWKVTYSL